MVGLVGNAQGLRRQSVAVIRTDRGEEVAPGIWAYTCFGHPAVCGRSRQPLLDACRQLKRLYGVTARAVGLFRDGSEVPDISCTIEIGAETTVSEPDRGGGPRFIPFKAFAMASEQGTAIKIA